MILLLILVFIRYYIDRGRLLFCPCSGCKAASLTELGVGYAWENSTSPLVRHCVYVIYVNVRGKGDFGLQNNNNI